MKETVFNLRKYTLKYLRVMVCDVSQLLSNSSEKNTHTHTCGKWEEKETKPTIQNVNICRKWVIELELFVLYLGWISIVQLVKNLPANTGDARDVGSITGSGRFLGEEHGNLLQYPCLENSMDKGAWQATGHGAAKSQTQLSAHVHTHTHIHTILENDWINHRC